MVEYNKNRVEYNKKGVEYNKEGVEYNKKGADATDYNPPAALERSIRPISRYTGPEPREYVPLVRDEQG